MAKASVPRSKMVKRPYKKRYVRKSKPSFLTRAVDVGTKVAKLAGTVKTIASMINAEKKYIDQPILDVQQVGQHANDLNTAWIESDITPKPAVGTAYNQRNGQSIKLHSLAIRIIGRGNTGTIAPTRVKFMIFRTATVQSSISQSASIMNEIFDPDQLTGMTDYFAKRNPNFYRDYALVAQKVVRLKGDSYSGQTGNQFDLVWNIKMNHHIRFAQSTQTLTGGQLLLVVVADTGNAGGNQAQSPFFSNPQPFSGVILSGSMRSFYYDN